MVKKIKRPQPQGIPAIPLPFPPNQAPGHAEVVAAAGTIVTLAEVLFQGNPLPIITALKAAEHAYVTSIKEEPKIEISDEKIEDQEVLGIQVAAILIDQAKKAAEQAQSQILQPDTRLVGADGKPIMSAPSAPQMHPGPSARAEADANAPTEEGAPVEEPEEESKIIL